jgi:hypothetical protein
MAYRLTLTAAERSAIDWVGNRYRHGDELYRLLWAESRQSPDDADWDDPRDIEFAIPESVAWTIGEIIDDGLDCFAGDLCHKLYEFRGRIV